MSEPPAGRVVRVPRPASRIGHNGAVSEGSGKHAGARRADPADAPPAPRNHRLLLVLALATTLCLVAWGYLVWAAIDFGRTARAGDSGAWIYLAVASLGAITCLFIGLLLVVRLLRALNPTSPHPTPGGRRAKR
ncbi:conserved hypothetical protein [metagenome]|uniref:Uncharacterized protein n=1 Tax=metagenome TaxID=256318 RepID=A0A2P2CEL3_9ZZZZ